MREPLEPQAAGRIGADSALALKLSREISSRVNDEIEGLIKSPSDRRAGRIEAFREVLAMISPTDRRDQ